jgi:nucleotide-binding universal stress UspA family protein
MAPTPPTAEHPEALGTGDDVGAPATFLVPLDGTDFSLRAVPVAERFAAAFDADLHAFTTPQTLDASERAAMPTWLESLVAETTYPRFRASVVEGDDPALAVVEQVGASPRSVVCMATHARGPIGSVALGNVASQVLRQIDVPVLLVGPHCAENAPRHGPMLVAHDGSVAADAVLAPARAWAHACGLPIVLVHVYHPLDVPTAEHPLDAIRPAFDFLGRETTVEVVASSFPAGAIRDLAHELDASVVALGTHGRTRAASVVMGSVAVWVTRESPCPTLVVRPRDPRTS